MRDIHFIKPYNKLNIEEAIEFVHIDKYFFQILSNLCDYQVDMMAINRSIFTNKGTFINKGLYK